MNLRDARHAFAGLRLHAETLDRDHRKVVLQYVTELEQVVDRMEREFYSAEKYMAKDRHLGRAIKTARSRAGLRQHELAEKLDVTANYISLVENDKRDPSWGFVCRLADVLQVPLPLLLLLAEGSSSPDGEDASDGRSGFSRDLLALVMATR